MGYEEENSANDVTIISFFVILIVMFIFIIWTIDILVSNSSTTNNIFLKSDCNYELPSNMEIVTNGDKYIVAINKGGILGIEYLVDSGTDGIKDYPPSISKPTFLKSECKARAFAKKYIKQKIKKQQAAWDDSDFK